MTKLHHDRGDLAAPLTGLVIEGRAARTHGPGDPLVYGDGPEYRDMAELVRIKDQLVGVVVRLDHGGRDVGRVIAARVDGEHVVATILLSDPTVMDIVRGGTRELSLGYLARLDDTRHQREINLGPPTGELALVRRARCGASCAVRVDCAEKTERQLADDLRARIADAWRGDSGTPCTCNEK